MSGVNILSNAELVKAYRLAISLDLEVEFIAILFEELNRRELKY
ncbi:MULTISPECIES: sporulation histidine kinase inhibitor Sda [Bacillaceae]|nr:MULTISPECIES: sporulation histidine kinase inhibitor Sda [Bacillaceae]MCE4049434.1 sporulation histidine kinase inhibitor Sda [Bacillus sp. Au-Bac7]MCM3029692.1 sporulation histidine kinase inhibitor Sda [Niallia sp. MER 6]MDL0437617.1 sporulation histidine kinase inhibitor Sda [Niallia sp. SS-2023]UPO87220.1 sporulation histidine kinase inhibitor Sda [Niallia sp. Man26]